MPANLLSASRLSFYRARQPLFEKLDFELSSGEILWVAGANGVGKTTLLRVVAGLLEPDEGKLSWNGKQLQSLVGIVNYVGHKDGIKSQLTAEENIALAQALFGSRRSIEEALESVGLVSRAKQLCGSMSAGQRRRTAFARLIACSAAVWIIDEPFNALDDTGKRLLEAQLESFLKEGGIAIVASHQTGSFLSVVPKKISL